MQTKKERGACGEREKDYRFSGEWIGFCVEIADEAAGAVVVQANKHRKACPVVERAIIGRGRKLISCWWEMRGGRGEQEKEEKGRKEKEDGGGRKKRKEGEEGKRGEGEEGKEEGGGGGGRKKRSKKDRKELDRKGELRKAGGREEGVMYLS